MEHKKTSRKKKKKYANAKAKMVFYGCRTITGASGGNYRYRRHYAAVESPNTVVLVSIVLPREHWQKEDRVNLDEEMNRLAKKYFPKAEIFMFYNRVSSMGIIPPKPESPNANRFYVENDFTKKS